MSQSPTDPAPDPARWRALAVCQLALFATLLDISVINVALPSIGRATGASPSQLQWLISGYVLAYALVPVLGGRLGDDRGRRTMFLIGVAGFVVTSLVVAVAPGPGLLITARVAQGLFGGLINPQVAGIVQQLFPGAERARAFGAIGATVGVAIAVGPVLGGLLIGLGGPGLGWRLVFLVNVPVGLVVLLLGRRWLPPAPPRPPGARRPALDVAGAGLLGLATLCVLFPTVQYDTVRDARLFWLLTPAPVLAWLFVRRERRLTRRDGDPLLDLRLFREPSYAIGVSFALLYFCAYTGLPLVVALYYQQGLGLTALQSGLGVTALAVGSTVAAPLAGRLTTRLGRPLLLAALVVFAVGAVGIAVLGRSTPADAGPLEATLRLAGPLLLLGLGTGAIITPNQSLSLAAVDPRMGGAAAGVLQTAQRIGSAIGQAVIGSAFFAALAGHPDYPGALTAAVLATLAFTAAALALGVGDLLLARRRA